MRPPVACFARLLAIAVAILVAATPGIAASRQLGASTANLAALVVPREGRAVAGPAVATTPRDAAVAHAPHPAEAKAVALATAWCWRFLPPALVFVPDSASALVTAVWPQADDGRDVLGLKRARLI